MFQSRVSLFPYIATAVTGLAIGAAVILGAPPLAAQQAWPTPVPEKTLQTEPRVDDRNLPDRSYFSSADRPAALASVQFALTEVADGSSYVWHRTHGLLSGVVRPTSSFKDATGAICRHFMVVLKAPERIRKTETIACRGADGVWNVSG